MSKTVTFAGETKLRLNDGRVEVFLEPSDKSGSYLLSTTAEGQTGKALGEHIRQQLLAAIPGARQVGRNHIEYTRPNSGELRFSLGIATQHSPNAGPGGYRTLVLDWHQPLNTRTLVTDLAALSEIIDAMNWRDLWVGPTRRVTKIKNAPAYETDRLSALLDLKIRSGALVTDQGFRLKPIGARSSLLLIGDLRRYKTTASAAEVVDHVRRNVHTPSVPVLLDLSVLGSQAAFDDVVFEVSQKWRNTYGLQLIRLDGSSVTFWDGSKPQSRLSAVLESSGDTLVLTDPVSTDLQAPHQGQSGADEDDRLRLLGACEHIVGPKRSVQLSTQEAKHDLQFLQHPQVPARTLMAGDVIWLPQLGQQQVIRVRVDNVLVGFDPQPQLLAIVSLKDHSAKVNLGIEQQVVLVSRSSS